MAGGWGCAWQKVGLHDRGSCVARGGGRMYGRGHAWQEEVGVGAWQDRRPLQWKVHILLECILVSFAFITITYAALKLLPCLNWQRRIKSRLEKILLLLDYFLLLLLKKL